MAADETAQQPRRRGRPPGSKSTTRTRRRLDGHERRAVRLHWRVCEGCRHFARHVRLMHTALKRWRD